MRPGIASQFGFGCYRWAGLLAGFIVLEICGQFVRWTLCTITDIGNEPIPLDPPHVDPLIKSTRHRGERRAGEAQNTSADKWKREGTRTLSNLARIRVIGEKPGKFFLDCFSFVRGKKWYSVPRAGDVGLKEGRGIVKCIELGRNHTQEKYTMAQPPKHRLASTM
ncbi:hypothetical protein DFH09DRAFT_1095996 [Mycena vulgaris]|nr:hypothetical protein DFH09DRAFT_1095996 [Mycena vulgaris]